MVKVEQEHSPNESIEKLIFVGANGFLEEIARFTIMSQGSKLILDGEASIFITRDNYYYLVIDMLNGRYNYVEMNCTRGTEAIVKARVALHEIYKLIDKDVEVALIVSYLDN